MTLPSPPSYFPLSEGKDAEDAEDGAHHHHRHHVVVGKWELCPKTEPNHSNYHSILSEAFDTPGITSLVKYYNEKLEMLFYARHHPVRVFPHLNTVENIFGFMEEIIQVGQDFLFGRVYGQYCGREGVVH